MNMKKEVKIKLIEKLREKGDTKMSPRTQWVVVKELRKVLKSMHPDIDFEDVKAKIKQIDTEKRTKIVGSRGNAWDNVLEFAGINRIDFYVPNYKFISKKTNFEINPKWSNGYEHPTTGSIIQHRFNEKNKTTYSEMADILEKHLN